MKTSIRTLLAIVCTSFIAGNSFANEESANPVQLNLKSYIRSTVSFMSGSNYNADKLMDKVKNQPNTARVCACQVLTLKNNNNEFENVALFSEKTNYGDLTADYKVASQLLVTENKQLKSFFFDKVEVVNKINAPTDCVSLYLKMKSQNEELKLYDILNADINRVKK
jgi:hypothetical protein